ncbi:MAG: tyrosine-type recombinase/integrase [Clostridium sp.]|nr:tyrosine-type recombinase/integrase [Clostridium sp.]
MSTTQPIRDPEKLLEFKEYYGTLHPNTRNYALCILCLNTALRITDVLHLKWGDIYDFSKETFHSHIMVTEKKTGKRNMIALNRTVKESFGFYMASLSSAPSFQTYLFPSRKGQNQPLSRYQAFRIIKEAARDVGLNEHISCHSLRKTFGYYAWQQGIPPALLMNIYNHSSYQITKRYLGIEQDDKDNVFMNIAL